MNELQNLIYKIGKWSDATFGPPKTRVIPLLKHFIKEAAELLEAAENYVDTGGGHKDLREEFGDCFMMLVDAARICKFSADELMTMTAEKLELNEKRSWGLPDKDGIIEHIKEELLDEGQRIQ